MLKIKPRSALITLLVIFVVYSVVKSPTEAANMTRNVVVFLGDVIRSIFTFFDKLLNR